MALVYLSDPDLILPRCEIEFTPMLVTGSGAMMVPVGSSGIVSGGSCLMGGSIVGASVNHHDVKN